MSDKSILLTDASDKQLLHFAREVLNLEVDGRNSRSSLLAKIAQVHDGSDIPLDVLGDDGDAGAPVSPRSAGSRKKKGELGEGGMNSGPMQGAQDVDHYEIRLNSTQEVGGSRPVPVGVNGTVMLIPRDKPVVVAAPYIRVLENAKRADYYPDGDGIPIMQEVPSFPFQILRGPFPGSGRAG